MTGAPPGGRDVAPVYRDDPRLAGLIGPGAPFEVEAVQVGGVWVRDFVRAPRAIGELFPMGEAHEERVNVVYGDERWTYAEMRRRQCSLARELASTLRVRPGDRVAIAMRNLPEFAVAFWGAALVGAVVVPMNSWWAGPELGYALADAGVSVLIADGECLTRVLGAGRPDGVPLVGVRSDLGDVAFDDLTAGAPIDAGEVAHLGRDDPVTLMYTSGTTGRPKGAVITNRAMIASLWNMAFATIREATISGRPSGPPRQSASISTGPLFHIGGISAIVAAPMSGSKMVLVHKWDLDEVLRLAVDEEVTGLGGVPAVARQILGDPRLPALGLDVRTFPMGGGPVPPDLPGRVIAVLGSGVQVLNGYGSTETTSAVVTNVGVELEARPDAVGRPNLTADVMVVDADGRALGTGEVGELCVRSPQVVAGYWNDEAATAASFRGGWFHTGDLGSVDDEGFVRVVDRLKDVVIRGGENVYCVEVEAVLHEHPAVAEVAVLGLAEPVMGERVCAVVVPRAGAGVRLTDLRAHVATRLAAFKCPEALWVTDELPRNATGKVEKPALRARVAAAEVERAW